MTTEPTEPTDEITARLLTQTRGNVPLARLMRANLEHLLRADDPELKRAAAEVLSGKRSVRGLLEVPAFTRVAATAVPEVRRQLDSMDPDERDKLVATTEETLTKGDEDP